MLSKNVNKEIQEQDNESIEVQESLKKLAEMLYSMFKNCELKKYEKSIASSKICQRSSRYKEA